jgi:radical SAM protein with 4Fe4S-binding SPASM domain
MGIKSKIYSKLPKKYRIKIKNFYYDKLIHPIYLIKNKLNYGVWDFFDRVGIETTTHCNLRCRFCPNSKYPRSLKKNEKLLETEIYKKIIDELSEINFKGRILPYSFGEPLTDKRIVSLVEYTKKKLPKARISLNSNGIFLTVPLYNRLVKAGVDCFPISQYGSEMPENMKKVFKYLKTRPKKENKIHYRVFTEGDAISNRGGEIEVPNVWEKPICTLPHTTVNIDYKGDVILCCNDYHSKVTFGNVKKEKLIDIWNKSCHKKIRKDLRRGFFNLEICKKCVSPSKV